MSAQSLSKGQAYIPPPRLRFNNSRIPNAAEKLLVAIGYAHEALLRYRERTGATMLQSYDDFGLTFRFGRLTMSDRAAK
jgi:hypothetical protein